MMKRILSVVFCISATAAICQAQSVLYFPQIAEGIQSDGSRWGTIIAITNPAPLGTGNASATLTVRKNDGTPWVINWQQYGGQGSLDSTNSFSIVFQLAAGQTTVFISPGELGQSTTALQTGFATIAPNAPFSATVIFSEFGPGGGRIAQAGVLSATPSTKQEIVATAPSPSGASNIYPPNSATSALALANPNGTTTANITFQLLDSSSFQVGSPVTRTLAASNQTAFFVNQLFPNTAIGGQLRITSDVPIVATALLFQSNGQFATFPVFPLP